MLRNRALRYTVVSLAAATLIGFTEAALVHMGTANMGRPLNWGRSISATLPSWFVIAALIPFVIRVARRFPLETLKQPRGIIAHSLAAVLYATTFLLVAGWLSDYVFYNMPRPVPFMVNTWRLFSNYFIAEVFQYAGIVGVYFAFDYSRRYREKERAASELALKASRLEASLTRANLEALRMQLNPHFLFNTLNTVSVLALKGERERVARIVSRLSDLLRLALENDRQTMALSEEIDFLRRYLEIEQVRFVDRLSVSIECDDASSEAEVPSLILQPLVENAVKYGFAQTAGPGNVAVSCRVKGSMLELQVVDTGPGFPDSQILGVGLSNTRARLEQLYGADFSLELSNRPTGGASVRIRIPYTKMGSEAREELMARQA